MRRLAILTVGALLSLTSLTASAGIVGLTGSVALIPTPTDLGLNEFNNPLALVMVERVDTTLDQQLNLNITQAGTYSDGGDSDFTPVIFTPGALPAGLQVDSFLMHYDPPLIDQPAVVTGSITFDTPILGIITGGSPHDLLIESDSIVGNPSTVYDESSGGRDFFDHVGAPDIITLSSDFRSVSFLSSVDGYFDEFRVITAVTAVPEPTTFSLFGLGLVGFGLMRRSRKTS